MLCIRGILGKGTLRMYPFSRVPTHPFRVLCLVARGIFLVSFLGANSMVELPHGMTLCDVCFGSLPDFPFPGAM